MKWFCQLGCTEPIECDPDAVVQVISDHLRVLHPDVPHEPQRWPDGTPVIVDTTLEPSDFGGIAGE